LGEKIHKPSYIEDIGELTPMAENIIQAIIRSKDGEIMQHIREQIEKQMAVINKNREQTSEFMLANHKNNFKPKTNF